MHEENNSLTVVEQLQQMEEKVAEQFQGVAIISEVTMDEGDYDSVLELVKHEIDHNAHQTAVDAVWQAAPKTMLLFTVTTAVNEYDANFWATVSDKLALAEDTMWRDAYMNALTAEGFATFKVQGVQQYVTAILGHTTVPRAQVKTFITRILQPAIDNGYSAEDIQTMMQHDAKNMPVKSHGLIRALKDYVKQSDMIVTDVLARALAVWKTQNRPFAENFAGVLPQHMLEGFDEVVIKVPRKVQEIIKMAVERPTLRYSVTDGAVYLQLPTQTFRRQVEEVIWTIESTYGEQHVSATRFAFENGETDFAVEKNAGRIAIAPKSTYNVTITVDGVVQGQWFLATEEFMVFDATTAAQIQAQEFSAKQFIAVFAKKHQKFTAIDGIDVMTTALSGEFAGYTAADVHVNKAFAYNTGDKRIVVYATARQFLLKGQKQQAVVASVPVYNGEFSIVVGKKTMATLSQAKQWTLTLTHLQSEEAVVVNLHEATFVENELGHNELTFPESFTTFMTEKPGHYTLKMASTFGKDAAVTFVYVPSTVVSIEQQDNVVTFETELGYKLVPTNVRTYVQSAVKNTVTLTEAFQKLNVTLTMPRTKEKLHFTYYPQQAAVTVVEGVTASPIGLVTNANDFNLEKAAVVIDIDHVHGLTQVDTVEVVVYETLQDGALNEVAVTVHATHPEVLPLAQFADATNTQNVRALHIRIDALQLNAPLVTVHPAYTIEDVTAAANTVTVALSENVHGEFAHLFNAVTATHVATQAVAGQTVTFADVAEGHYIVALQATTEFPTALTAQTGFVAVDTDDTLAQALLLNNPLSDEGEWEEDALRSLIAQIHNAKDVYVPLLVEDSLTCSDFGMINIETLQEIIAEQSAEARKVSLIIAGFQDWDNVSVERALGADYILVSNKTVYAPKKLATYANYKGRQFVWSYNYSPQQEQVFKGFSLTHEVLNTLAAQQSPQAVKQVAAFVQRFMQPLEQMVTTYANLPMVEAFAETVLSRKGEPFTFTTGLVAFWNSVLFFHEHDLSTEDVEFVREATPTLYALATELFMHDIVFWHAKLDAFDEAQKEHEVRRKQFENPSFGWKK